MNVMITGARGFLGKHLTNYLGEEHNLYLTARTEGDEKIDYLDLTSSDSADSYIKKRNGHLVEALVHMAGRLVDDSMSQEEQMQVFEDNIAITRNTVKLVQQMGIKVLVNCSSMAVYPNMDGMFDEKSEIRMSCNSECLYGLSKFCSENIFDYSLANYCRVVNLRLAQIYGEGMREDRIISIMKKSIMESNCVEVYGNGERISNFVSVDKICEVIGNVLKCEAVSGIYNVGGENITYLELAKQVKKRYGNDDTQIILKNAGSGAKFYLKTEKLDELWRRQGIF